MLKNHHPSLVDSHFSRYISVEVSGTSDPGSPHSIGEYLPEHFSGDSRYFKPRRYAYQLLSSKLTSPSARYSLLFFSHNFLPKQLIVS